MFDVGFWELVIIAAVALLVAGPEKLPGMVRDASRALRRIRRFVTETKYTIERELELDEGRDLKTRLDSMNDLMRIAPDNTMDKNTIHDAPPPDQKTP